MCSANLKKHGLSDEERDRSSQHAIEALRIASQGDPNVHLTTEEHLSVIHQDDRNTTHLGTSLAPGVSEYKEETFVPELTEFDLKSRESKYKRWSPRMDQYLIKLLSDVVHSFPKGTDATMTKKAWAYVTGNLRAANPETVYSTYTKYSCQQHLYNVNHHRYKIWFILMMHSKNSQNSTEYSYRWNSQEGKFQVYDNNSGNVINDEKQVKTLLYSEGLSLPALNSFNKGNIIVNDFFLTDNLRYMSLYHNEVLPLLIRLDRRYAEGLGDVYSLIPTFEVADITPEYFRPLVTPKSYKISPSEKAKRKPLISSHSMNRNEDVIFSNDISTIASEPSSKDVPVDDSVDPALKRPRNSIASNPHPDTPDLENVLVTAAIAAINSPPVLTGRDTHPIYIKNREWFNKLISLHESGNLSSTEVLTVCEGVRDRKIPLFMLNILDQTYYPTREGQEPAFDIASDDETAKRVREFMIPMTYNN